MTIFYLALWPLLGAHHLLSRDLYYTIITQFSHSGSNLCGGKSFWNCKEKILPQFRVYVPYGSVDKTNMLRIPSQMPARIQTIHKKGSEHLKSYVFKPAFGNQQHLSISGLPQIPSLMFQFIFVLFCRPDHLSCHVKHVHSSERPFKCQVTVRDCRPAIALFLLGCIGLRCPLQGLFERSKSVY